jgi:hypothetical protein
MNEGAMAVAPEERKYLLNKYLLTAERCGFQLLSKV